VKTTREGKPYCPGHVEMNPYARGIIAVRDSREQEIKAIKKGQPIDKDSALFEEVLVDIRNRGPRTVERIARDLMLDIKLIRKLVRVLKRNGHIKTGRTERGSTTVRLP
jgi:hypothetical protein